eukprot:sb/3474197/
MLFRGGNYYTLCHVTIKTSLFMAEHRPTRAIKHRINFAIMIFREYYLAIIEKSLESWPHGCLSEIDVEARIGCNGWYHCHLFSLCECDVDLTQESDINVTKHSTTTVGPRFSAPRFSDRINFPRYRKLTVFDPDLVATPI